ALTPARSKSHDANRILAACPVERAGRTVYRLPSGEVYRSCEPATFVHRDRSIAAPAGAVDTLMRGCPGSAPPNPTGTAPRYTNNPSPDGRTAYPAGPANNTPPSSYPYLSTLDRGSAGRRACSGEPGNPARNSTATAAGTGP